MRARMSSSVYFIGRVLSPSVRYGLEKVDVTLNDPYRWDASSAMSKARVNSLLGLLHLPSLF